MKVLFSADWHIKLGQKNVPVEWAKRRYYSLFDHFYVLGNQVDYHIIGGDIFDRTPTLEELELYFDFVADVNVSTIIYSGNHEAVKKNTTFLSNLKDVTNLLNSRVRIIDDYYSLENIDFIPYNKLKEYFPSDADFHGNILCTHVRGEIPPHVKPEVPLELFDRWDVVLAGDLHSYENCQRNILYPGAPLTTSFHRQPVDTGCIILDTNTLKHTWHKLKLPQLIRKTVKAGDPTPATHYDHTIYEVEGNLVELGEVQNNELIDKKVVRREIDTALILSAEMSLETEVDEYLTYVMQLDEPTRQAVLKELNNHVHHLQSR